MTQFDEEPTQPGPGGNLRNILLAVGAGVIAVVVIGYASQPREAPDTPTTQPLVVEEPEPLVTTTSPDESSPSTTRGPVALTLRDFMPEVNGTLVAALSGASGTRLLTWPADRPDSTSVGLPDGAGPVLFFDITDQLLAFLGPAIQRGGQTLYVGDTSTWTPLATEVTSFAWHATRPGRLAWVTADGLCVADFDPTRSIVAGPTCHPPITAHLAGFDDLGVLVVDNGDVIRLTLAGDEINRVPGTDAWVGPDGRVLVEDRDPSNLPVAFSLGQSDLSGFDTLDWAPTDAISLTRLSPWSPQAASPELAFLVPQGLAGYQIQRWNLDGSQLNAFNVGGRYWDIGWDRSGRYLLAPGESSGDHLIVVYDLFLGQPTAVPLETWVQETQLVIPAVCEDASYLQTDWEFRYDTPIDDLWMVVSRDGGLDSWRFLSGRILDGPGAGEIATWALPAYSGDDPPQQSIPANSVAMALADVVSLLLPEDYGVSSWMLLDGAIISQWCVTAMG